MYLSNLGWAPSSVNSPQPLKQNLGGLGNGNTFQVARFTPNRFGRPGQPFFVNPNGLNGLRFRT